MADFKHYLRGRTSSRREIGHSRSLKKRDMPQSSSRRHLDNLYGEYSRVDASRPWERGLSHIYGREDARVLRKESDWLQKNLKSLTRA